MADGLTMHDRLITKLLRGTAPLIIWALHFGVCYGVVAAQCSPALYTPAMPSLWLLWVATAVASALCGGLLWRSRGALAGRTGPRSLVDIACAASAVLALAGMVWTSVPLLLLDGCG